MVFVMGTISATVAIALVVSDVCGKCSNYHRYYWNSTKIIPSILHFIYTIYTLPILYFRVTGGTTDVVMSQLPTWRPPVLKTVYFACHYFRQSVLGHMRCNFDRKLTLSLARSFTLCHALKKLMHMLKLYSSFVRYILNFHFPTHIPQSVVDTCFSSWCNKLSATIFYDRLPAVHQLSLKLEWANNSIYSRDLQLNVPSEAWR
jgi:hypothetical protein